jgi:hypothetical protein
MARIAPATTARRHGRLSEFSALSCEREGVQRPNRCIRATRADKPAAREPEMRQNGARVMWIGKLESI